MTISRPFALVAGLVPLLGLVWLIWPSGSAAAPELVEAPVVVEIDYAGEARDAALAYARLPQRLLFAESSEIRDLVSAAATPQYLEAFEDELLPELTDVRVALANAAPATTWWTTVPLSLRAGDVVVTASGSRTVESQVWTVEMFSRAGVADPELSFSIIDMSMEWTGTESGGGVWRITRWAKDVGPAPGLATSVLPTSASELDDVLAGHRLVPVELPTAVGGDASE